MYLLSAVCVDVAKKNEGKTVGCWKFDSIRDSIVENKTCGIPEGVSFILTKFSPKKFRIPGKS